MVRGQAWSWLGLLALTLFVVGMSVGGFVASAFDVPEVLGAVPGAAVGFLGARWVLRTGAENRV